MASNETNRAQILLVDDGIANIKIAESYLHSEGYCVTTAQTGGEALKCVENNEFDLIMLDVMLPEMDGFEVCQKLKLDPKTKDIPIIFLTVLSDADDIVKGFAVGGIDYITKPFNSLELIARVRAHLQCIISRKHLELDKKRLMASEQDLLCLLESVNSGILIVDPDDNKIVDANSAALSMIEQPVEYLVGTDYTQLFISCDDSDNILDSSENELFSMECKLTTFDGRVYDVIQKVTEVETSEKKYLLVNFIDITDRKHIELLREDINRIIQHDLKGPLNAIVALPEIIKDNISNSSENVQLLNLIEEAGYQMLGMINLSLDMYKMESKSYQLNPVPVDIVALLKRIIQEQRIYVNEYNLSFNILINGSTCRNNDTFFVFAEELLCYSMFSNIIKNAAEASGCNDVVTIKLSDDKASLISVHNSGIVPIEIRNTFFDKYSTSGKRNGTGLGTYSAKLIAETLGGSISMESSEDIGTTITVELPLPK